MDQLKVIKIGGKVVEDQEVLDHFLKDFASIAGSKILVHGGGKWVSNMCSKLDIPVKMIDGRRVTDAQTLEVVTMMLAGLANKTVVSGLQKYGCNAIGLTGADGDVLRAHKRPLKNGIDFGYVGDLDTVNIDFLKMLLSQGLVPVMAAMSHDGMGQMLNTNADTIASSVACALAESTEVELIYCFELKGVLRDFDDKDSVIGHVSKEKYETLKADGIISDGMVPKIDNAFAAIDKGVNKVRICHASEIKNINLGKNVGTIISN